MSYKKSPFENAPKKHVNKTRFNLSHEHKSQMLPGLIFPCMRPVEVMPSDELSIQSQFFFRFESLYYPIMHKITMRADYYYIPYRILWPKGTGTNVGWMDWLTKMEDVAHPIMNANMAFDTAAFPQHVLAYMGVPLLPPSGTAGHATVITSLNAFPLSAILMIWDWYERNPQLEDEIWFPLQDGDNTPAFEAAFGIGAGLPFPLLSAKWEKDMFTSALPQPQVGTAIQIPLVAENSLGPTQWVDSNGNPVGSGDLQTKVTGDTEISVGPADVFLNIQETAAVMKQLREAEVLQAFHERVMKIGDRYDDYILGLYGTQPQPGVINIPVLLGSVFGKVQISDVMSTGQFSNTSTLPKVGDYSGQANLFEEGKPIRYTCHEHGVIIATVQLNANTGYGQGIDRMWRRSVQTDYPLDMFATIGDQEILKEEVMYNSRIVDAAMNQETFGYIDRFAEAKFMNDLYVGNLAFNVGLSQHLGRWWDPVTVVGATYSDNIEIGGGLYGGFINASPYNQVGGGHRLIDVFRILPAAAGGTATPVNLVNYPTQGTTFAWIFHSITVDRPLPLYSTPKL